MPINAETGITYDEGSLNSRFVVRVNGVITNYQADWIRVDGGPVSGGLPAGYEYFLRQPAADRSAYDHRFQVLGTWTCVPADPAPQPGHPAGVYSETVDATMLSSAELKEQVQSAMVQANTALYPRGLEPGLIARALEASRKEAKGEVIPADLLPVLSALSLYSELFRYNEAQRIELDAVIDRIEAGEDDLTYDLTTAFKTAVDE